MNRSSSPSPTRLWHPGVPETQGAALIDNSLSFRRLLTRLNSRLLFPTDSGGEPLDTLLISLPISEVRRQALLRRLERLIVP